MKKYLTYGLITLICALFWLTITTCKVIETYLRKEEIEAAHLAENSGGSYPFNIHIFNDIFGSSILTIGVFIFLTVVKLTIQFTTANSIKPIPESKKETEQRDQY